MMGSCGAMSSSLRRSRYVSWCVDPAESPIPVTTALSAAAPEEFSHQNHQLAGPGSVPLLLLTPPETSGGETNTTISHHLTLTKRTHDEAFTHSHQLNPHSSSAVNNSDKAPNHLVEDEDDSSDEGGKVKKEDLSLLYLEDTTFLLPRSSPVISRRHRPISWHGGGTDTSALSSLDSLSPTSGLLSPNQQITSVEDLGSKTSSCPLPSPLQENKKPRCISSTSHLNRLSSAGLQTDDYCRNSLSTSTQPNKQRRSSGIPELHADIFKTSCDLEKENAHFIVVDMVLEVLERVKWTLSSDGWTSSMDTHCDMCTQRHTHSWTENVPPHEQRCETNRHTQTCSPHRNTHSSNVHTQQHRQDEEEEEAGNDEAEHPPKTFSVLSTDSGFEDCGVDTTLTPRDSLINAEWLAQRLVLEFRRNWLPSREPRRGRQSLRSSLQELPGTGAVAVSSGSLAEEIRLRTRMRGSLSWAPPRFQIIFTVQPAHRRSEVVALQHFLCAGCGTEVEPRYIKKLRYCEYLGRYFCDCCHSGAEAVIPGRLLSCWDFSRYSVSDFSKQLLDSLWNQPLFDLTCVGKTLYRRVKELDKFRELREQLMDIKKLLKACRLSGRVMAEFEQFPAHLLEHPHLFSMDDLWRVKKGQLVTQARALLHSAVDHVENCELCLARGFICEFCRERDIIFPFQRDICRRCPVCRACFHKHCFVEKKCPKCARIQSRKKPPDRSMK